MYYFYKFVLMDILTIKIFTRTLSSRLDYIAEFILSDLLGVSFEITSDKRKLGKSPVINYSSEEIKGTFKIIPSGLLFETGVRPLDLTVTWWNGLPAFFLSDGQSDFPFDIFSAAFFVITRYEEYLDFEPDNHGRFPASKSLAFRSGFLNKPVINLWVKELSKLLILKFPNVTFKRNTFKAITTFDVDEPFKYLGKDMIRNIGGFLREIGKNDMGAAERYRIVLKKQKDPWDIFDYIFSMTIEKGNQIIVFFPVGDRTDFDRWPSYLNDDYRKLITGVSEKTKTGLHPSYYSCDNTAKLNMEKERLHQITNSEIIAARYHFIRLKFPDSYSNLVDAGFSEDYSMGFPDEPGFRAGTSNPFFFYDLSSERKTNLVVFPFQIMDATLIQYKKFQPEESMSVIKKIIDETKNAGGLFHSSWHNKTLVEGKKASEWKKVFENTLNYQNQ